MKSRELVIHLKIMSKIGQLPFCWNKEGYFEPSRLKHIFKICINLFVSFSIIFYIPMVSVFTRGDNFNPRSWINITTYNSIYNTSTTTSIVYIAVFQTGLIFTWMTTESEKNVERYNRILKQSWFSLRWKKSGISGIFFTIGLVVLVLQNSCLVITHVTGEKGFAYYLWVVVGVGVPILQVMAHNFFYGVLLRSLLFGWMKSSPPCQVTDNTRVEGWNVILESMKNWLRHYDILQELFSGYLLSTIAATVPFTIGCSYLIVTFSQFGNQDVFRTVWPLVTLLLSGFLQVYTLVDACEKSYCVILKKKQEILVSTCIDGSQDACLRQVRLTTMLDSSLPFTAQGYFPINKSLITSIMGATVTYIVILIQFGERDPGKVNAG